MSGQTISIRQSKPSNLPDKCPMSGANLQACHMIFHVQLGINKHKFVIDPKLHSPYRLVQFS